MLNLYPCRILYLFFICDHDLRNIYIYISHRKIGILLLTVSHDSVFLSSFFFKGNMHVLNL